MTGYIPYACNKICQSNGIVLYEYTTRVEMVFCVIKKLMNKEIAMILRGCYGTRF